MAPVEGRVISTRDHPSHPQVGSSWATRGQDLADADPA